MASTGQSYKLDLNTGKRNVFVTQLHDRFVETNHPSAPSIKLLRDSIRRVASKLFFTMQSRVVDRCVLRCFIIKKIMKLDSI